MGGSPTQELTQGVCQKYGWSVRFAKEKSSSSSSSSNNHTNQYDNDDNDNNDDNDDESYYWVCYIVVGLNDERKFISSCTRSEDTEEGRKGGIAAASQAALIGLQEELARQESKPKKELTDLFPMPVHPMHNNTHNSNNTHNNSNSNSNNNAEKNGTTTTTTSSSSNSNNNNTIIEPPLFVIRGSSPRNWNHYIWSHKPSVVGIDTEGNLSTPPLLVQIATDECVILEITSMLGNQLSDNLQRLLADNDIIKVFCDNSAHKDKRSLGILPPLEKKKRDNNVSKKKNVKGASAKGKHTNKKHTNDVNLPDFSKGTIVDLEALAATVLGPATSARGLSRIVTLTMPELNVLVGKPPASKGGRWKDIGRFAMIEQGKAPPIAALRDLTRKQQHYAAVDAWATLQAYKWIRQAQQQQVLREKSDNEQKNTIYNREMSAILVSIPIAQMHRSI